VLAEKQRRDMARKQGNFNIGTFTPKWASGGDGGGFEDFSQRVI
jgi:hypothetical protein